MEDWEIRMWAKLGANYENRLRQIIIAMQSIYITRHEERELEEERRIIMDRLSGIPYERMNDGGFPRFLELWEEYNSRYNYHPPVQVGE